MSISTFAELKSSIADFLNRDDLTSVIPTFIKLAEADINRNVRHWRMENRATAEVDSQYSAIPTDLLEPIRLHIEGKHNPLDLTNAYEIQVMRKEANDRTGKPTHYSFTQGEIELFPTPDTTYNLEMYYYAKVPSLSDSQTTNVILTHEPDIYLYGSLIHSAPYLADDARTQVWASLYSNAVSATNSKVERTKFGGSGIRMKLRSY